MFFRCVGKIKLSSDCQRNKGHNLRSGTEKMFEVVEPNADIMDQLHGRQRVGDDFDSAGG